MRGRRVDPQHDQRVDALVDELGGQLLLQHRAVRRVDDQRVPARLEQLAAQGGGDVLLPDVLQRAAQHADVAGAPGGERAGDRVDLVAEPVGDLAHALLRLDRDLQPAQRVRHGGGREPALVRDVAKSDTLRPLAHRTIVTAS